MTEWEVFGVIAGLATFVIAIVTPIIKLNSTSISGGNGSAGRKGGDGIIIVYY